jgi:hypothetical protein
MMASAQSILLPGRMRRSLAIPMGILAAILTSWLLFPLLTPVHVEGFTASVASLALHLDRDLITNFDVLQPLNTEYFGLSKLGWVLGTAGLIKLGLRSEWAMTVLNWTGLFGLCFASIILVRKWTRAPVLLIMAGLLLLPGISESAFFFNDNILSSSLAALALAALYLPRLELGAAICGLLFGFAVLTRTDTILIGVAVPLILWERLHQIRATALALAVSGLFGSVALAGTLALFHVSIFDLFRVTQAAVASWNRDEQVTRPILMAAYFLGLPGALLVICGLVTILRRKDWLVAARLLAAPLLYALLIGSKLWETRQFLPLTPFILALAIGGFRSIWSREGILGTVLRGVVGALLCLSLLGPAAAGSFDEGPRALTGRLANVEQWRRWQTDVDDEFMLLRAIPKRATGGHPTAIIADFWTEDRYSHLVLEEAGFAVKPSANSDCASIAEHFVKGSREIYLIRPHQSYVPYWRQLSGERLKRFGLPCIDATRSDVLFVSSGDRMKDLLGPAAAGPADAAYVPMRVRPLDLATLSRLVEGYRADANEDRRSGMPAGSIDDGISTTRKITKFH